MTSDPGAPADDGGAPPVDDFASQVLDVVDSIPPGHVMSYGDIAEYLGAGPGPRQVGRVLAVYGGAVAWWRVIHSDGTPAPGHDSRALEHYLAEGTPLPFGPAARPGGYPPRPLARHLLGAPRRPPPSPARPPPLTGTPATPGRPGRDTLGVRRMSREMSVASAGIWY